MTLVGGANGDDARRIGAKSTGTKDQSSLFQGAAAVLLVVEDMDTVGRFPYT